MAAKALTNYQMLVKKVKEGTIAPVYLFYGQELVLARYVVSVLQERLIPAGMESINAIKVDGSKLSEGELIQQIQTPPMFGEKRLLIIEQPAFAKPRKDVTYEQLLNLLGDWPEFACAVFLSRELDKRTKVVKQLMKVAETYEFPALSVAEAIQWVESRLAKTNLRLPRGTSRTVVERVGTNLEALRLELDKLVSFADGKSITEEDLLLLLSQNTETNVFDMVDALGRREIAPAFALLDELLKQGEEPLYLLAMIARQWRLLLAARYHLDAGLSSQEAASRLGIHPFPAGKCVQQAFGWRAPSLQEALTACLMADEAIKTGELKGDRALEELIISLARL